MERNHAFQNCVSVTGDNANKITMEQNNNNLPNRKNKNTSGEDQRRLPKKPKADKLTSSVSKRNRKNRNIIAKNPEILEKNDGCASEQSKAQLYMQKASNPLPVSICVNLDWLTFLLDMPAAILPPDPVSSDLDYFQLTDDLILENLGRGTSIFKNSFALILSGELVGTIHMHPKRNKIFDPNTVQIDIANNVLYSHTWKAIVNDLQTELQGTIKSISRLDIAIDGLNSLPIFLNGYCKQTARNKKIDMIGKARFDPKILDKKTMLYKAFKIGSGKSPKQISIYNKTSDINRTGKYYIRDVWAKSGLDLTVDNYRAELRMKSKAIKEIADFDLNRCWDPKYLLQIFRTHIKNFFEFYKITSDTNVTRARKIDLFEFDNLKVTLLDKVPRKLTDTIYKAKLTVHQTVADVIRKILPDESVAFALHHMAAIIDAYQLKDYYEKKLPEWNKRYCTYVKDRYAPPELTNIFQMN